MRHGLAAAGDNHLLPRLYLVQKLAEAGLSLSQTDRDHDNLMWS